MSIDADALRAPVTHPFDDVQFWETKRQITHAEARESAARLINSHFRNEDRARVSIPANPDRDDDLIIQSYIRQQARAARSGDLIHRPTISEETARADEAERDCIDMMWQRRRADERAETAEAGLASALAAIAFAEEIDDHYEAREFLKGWSEGDTSEWPEFNASPEAAHVER